ncbi:LysR family transcriptional regulator [Kitasatospora sp. NPDC059327]|uniref:LysR family transcriptional regulator n=1 Tax=Kitasatospora sp. NPDC059327 TaxID=3346803 RepID=UPI0036893C60
MGNRPAFSLTQLLYFATIAETGNISEAAARLHASQSAVSSAIQRLERQLGIQLLLRQRAKGVSLTPCGRLLLNDARKILLQVNNLEDNSNRFQGETAGHLDIGSCATITPFLIPRALTRVGYSHPGLNVAVHDTHTPVDLLRNGVCELAVTYSLSSAEDTCFTELATPPLYAVVAQNHPLATTGKASLAELSDETLLMPNPNLPPENSPLAYVRNLFTSSGIPLPKIANATGIEAMRGLVAAGWGFMLTHHRPRSMETLDGGRVALVEITGEHPHVSVGVLTMAGSMPSQRARAFVAALRATARQVYAPVSAVAA